VRYPTGWYTFEIRSEEPLAGEAAPEGGGGEAETGEVAAEEAQLPADVAGREGIGFAPEPSDPFTVFTVWASPLGQPVVAEDLETLRVGVDEGLSQLAECRIEEASEMVLGNLIRFERIYSFLDSAAPDRPEGSPGVVRRRKQWLLYVDRWLICLTWQGATPEAYEYWFAMANHSFLTFELPQALWFFTDREMLTTPRSPEPPASS
jgi:hypothetical protein